MKTGDGDELITCPVAHVDGQMWAEALRPCEVQDRQKDGRMTVECPAFRDSELKTLQTSWPAFFLQAKTPAGAHLVAMEMSATVNDH